jgi:hypothetical protein
VARAGLDEFPSEVVAPLTRLGRLNQGQSCLLGPGRRGQRDRGPPLGREGVSLPLSGCHFYRARVTRGRFQEFDSPPGQPRTSTARCSALARRQQERHLMWHALSALTEEAGTGRGS